MFKVYASLLGLAGLVLSPLALAAALSPQPAWQSPYTGAQATGDSVIGLWRFDGGAPTADASGHGHTLKLQPTNSKFVPDGKFGGALQVAPGDPPVDKPYGVTTPDKDDLTPKGAFTIEMWIQPDAHLASLKDAFLLDKKGYAYAIDRPHANDDYLLHLVAAPKGQFYLDVWLGYGKDSDHIRSNPVTLEAGQWYHVGYSYDGRGGSRFSLNGRQEGIVQHKGRGPVSNGIYPLTIGDRVMSIHQPFSGKIDEVRLCNRAILFTSGKVSVDTTLSRTAFYRHEKDAALHLRIANESDKPLDGASVTVRAAGIAAHPYPLKVLQPLEAAMVDVPVDTQLQIGKYQASVTVTDAQGKPLADAVKISLTIVPRPMPHEMPVMMWGMPDSVQELKDIGFTDCLVWVPEPLDLMKTGQSLDERADPQWQNIRKSLDDMMALGIGGAAELQPPYRAAPVYKQYDRINRQGELYKNLNMCGQFPQVQDFCYNIGATVAKTLGDLPALKASLINSEIRDGTEMCFHDIDKAAYKKFSGKDIPAALNSPRGVLYQSLANFPASHIVPDNQPLLEYLRWFWKQGDGWNQLNSRASDGIHSTGRSDVWTWYDPAIRVPSVWGSGGDVNVISQWTYTYPDPLKVGLACDDLMAMAQGNPAQQVMNMIQIIWYRSQTAPIPAKGQKPPAHQAQWEKQCPDAEFISIAPDHLSEGMWLELARPIKGIMNHGWGSLGDKVGYKQGSYVTTNTQTRVRLSEMLHKVVEPLGPTLMQVPDRPADVAYLQSFASQMLAGRGTYGWGGGWGADAYMVVRYAALQPQIVYDETIEKYGLDQYKVLILADCDVLTQSVADAIDKFQARGGIVVGDEHLAPGITPDIVIQSYASTGKPQEDKAALQALAAKLRKDLTGFYTRAADTSNPDVIVRLRRYGDSDYLFAVNDHRTFGDYVGQHGLVMEKGLPSQSTLSLNRAHGFIYDLSQSKAVTEVRTDNGHLTFASDFGPGQGRLFLVTSREIAAVHVTAPARAKASQSITCAVAVTDDSGKAINAVVPIQVQITDANGKPCEYSGYYGARDGQVQLHLDLPDNATAGTWTVAARELASGRSAQASITISR